MRLVIAKMEFDDDKLTFFEIRDVIHSEHYSVKVWRSSCKLLIWFKFRE